MEKMKMQAEIKSYLNSLREEERSVGTISQYQREIQKFLEWVSTDDIKKETVISYKEYLSGKYMPSTVNTKLAALNSYFTFLHNPDLKVRQLKIQQKSYCSQEKELTRAEYARLVKCAYSNGDERLALLLQTICSTGIRVSELKYITVDAVMRGNVVIQLKGKNRTILLPGKLCKLLKKFIRQNHISDGPVFVTRTGKPLDRSNVWRMMKELCKTAKVDSSKVFPHNLRHLFARCFYSLEHDIAHLADILGHSSINTTRIYIVTTMQEHQRQLAKMDLVMT